MTVFDGRGDGALGSCPVEGSLGPGILVTSQVNAEEAFTLAMCPCTLLWLWSFLCLGLPWARDRGCEPGSPGIWRACLWGSFS